MTRAGNKNEIESSEGGEGKPGPKPVWSERVYKSGKKSDAKERMLVWRLNWKIGEDVKGNVQGGGEQRRGGKR